MLDRLLSTPTLETTEQTRADPPGYRAGLTQAVDVQIRDPRISADENKTYVFERDLNLPPTAQKLPYQIIYYGNFDLTVLKTVNDADLVAKMRTEVRQAASTVNESVRQTFADIKLPPDFRLIVQQGQKFVFSTPAIDDLEKKLAAFHRKQKNQNSKAVDDGAGSAKSSPTTAPDIDETVAIEPVSVQADSSVNPLTADTSKADNEAFLADINVIKNVRSRALAHAIAQVTNMPNLQALRDALKPHLAGHTAADLTKIFTNQRNVTRTWIENHQIAALLSREFPTAWSTYGDAFNSAVADLPQNRREAESYSVTNEDPAVKWRNAAADFMRDIRVKAGHASMETVAATLVHRGVLPTKAHAAKLADWLNKIELADPRRG